MGREVVLVLDSEWAEIPRVAGRIVRVATTGTFALVDDGGATAIHVPLAVVLAVRRPHFTEPLDTCEPVPPDTLDGQLVLVYPDG